MSVCKLMSIEKSFKDKGLMTSKQNQSCEIYTFKSMSNNILSIKESIQNPKL